MLLQGPRVESMGINQYLLKIFRKLLQTLSSHSDNGDVKIDYINLDDFLLFLPLICYFFIKKALLSFLFLCLFTKLSLLVLRLMRGTIT